MVFRCQEDLELYVSCTVRLNLPVAILKPDLRRCLLVLWPFLRRDTLDLR